MNPTARRLLRVLLLCLLTGTLAGASPAMAAPPPNNDFASATELGSVTSATIIGTNVEATTESGEPTCCFTDKTVWYRWTSPKTGNYRVELCASDFNTHLKVLKGTAVNTLEEVADNEDDPGCGPDGTRSRLTFVGFAGQRYEIQVGSKGGAGAGTISGSIALVSPANDFFADTTLLEGVSATITGTNVDATTESGEETCCFTDKTVWYRWTSPKTGNYRAQLCGSSYNSFLKVFKGTAVNALERVAENDDDAGCGADGSRSRLTFIAFAGQRYELQVGSKAGTGAGTIDGSIALVSPPNDFFADATTLSGSPVAIAGTNVDASTESGEPTCCFTSGTVWYRWTPPAAGNYRVEVCGSDFNTYLKVFKGTAVNALETVKESNDEPGCGAAGDRSAVTFSAAATTVYSIQVGSGGEPRGTIAGSISPAPATPTVFNPAGNEKAFFFAPGSKPPAAKSKGKGKKKKTTINIRGVLGVPPTASKAVACRGNVTITITARKRLIRGAIGKAKVSTATCKYSKKITFLRRLVKGKKVTVVLEFPGNSLVARAQYKRQLTLKS